METNTIIIGASAAGLAVAACLQRQNIPTIILEKEQHVGHAWRNHYARLHLHTDREHSKLPYLPMPKSYPKYPSRQQVVDYLDSYAQEFDIEPLFGEEVISVEPISNGWLTTTTTRTYSSQNVVVATGYTRVPNVPSWPGQEKFTGTIMHSHEYQDGSLFVGQNVLVVGFGNSAGEIAIDLSEHRAQTVSMSVRSGVNVIPRDMFGIPILSIAIFMDYLPPQLADILSIPLLRMSVGNISKYGLPKLPYGPNVQVRQDGKNPLLDIGTMKLIKNGRIRIFPAIESFEGDTIIFADGSIKPFDAVVLGTGYTPQVNQFLPSMDDLFDEKGAPLHSGEEAAPGLYFCGFYVSPTGVLREIGIEAKKIAKDIGEK